MENGKQIRVYYIGKNPKVPSHIILREICSDDLGKTWYFGRLGTEISYEVMPGTGINAVVLPANENDQLRVYFSYADSVSLAVAWMPIVGDPHDMDWNIAPNLYPASGPW
jgi:hypothetical protein